MTKYRIKRALKLKELLAMIKNKRENKRTHTKNLLSRNSKPINIYKTHPRLKYNYEKLITRFSWNLALRDMLLVFLDIVDFYFDQ